MSTQFLSKYKKTKLFLAFIYLALARHHTCLQQVVYIFQNGIQVSPFDVFQKKTYFAPSLFGQLSEIYNKA